MSLFCDQLLDHQDVVAVHQEVGGEGVAEGVAGRRLDEAGGRDRIVESLLDAAVVEVIAVGSTGRLPRAGWRCASGPEGRRDREAGRRAQARGAGAAPEERMSLLGGGRSYVPPGLREVGWRQPRAEKPTLFIHISRQGGVEGLRPHPLSPSPKGEGGRSTKVSLRRVRCAHPQGFWCAQRTLRAMGFGVVPLLL